MYIELATSCWRFIANLKDDVGNHVEMKSESGTWHDLWVSTDIDSDAEQACENVGHYINLQKFQNVPHEVIEAAINEYLNWPDGFTYCIIVNNHGAPEFGAVILTGDGPVNGAHYFTTNDIGEIRQFLVSHGVSDVRI